MSMTMADVEAVCGLVLDLCGVYLDESKSYLIETRLEETVRRTGCDSYLEFVDLVRRTADFKLKREVVDAITTQETLFFRDGSPFEALRNKALPELIDSKASTPFRNRLRVWSAGCSTGQEPYSIAMTICDLLPEVEAWDIQILATDISDSAIAKASRGCYLGHEIERGLSSSQLSRYFTQANDQWRIQDRIRSMISFRQFNLHECFAELGQFDVIFCRNVAIYFTPEARQSLFERLVGQLTEFGYLFVGSSESLLDLGNQFKPQHHCRSVFYQPRLVEQRQQSLKHV